MSNFSDFYGGGVKSVQRGVAMPTSPSELSVTVTAVNPAKAMLNLLSANSSPRGSAAEICVMSVRLVNATTVGVSAFSGSSGAPTVYHGCSWELIEFA